MTNPNQEPAREKLSLGQAIRAIAERTAFRTEAERDDVLATLDEHIDAEGRNADEQHDAADDETPNEPETPETPRKATAARRGR